MRELVYIPDPALYKVCEPVVKFSTDLRVLIADMRRVISKYNGVGLAAPQVGSDQRVLLYMPINSFEDLSRCARVLVNPEITAQSETTNDDWEGCLSSPGIQANITRADWIEVKAKDMAGKDIKARLEKLSARIVQHEIDHLNGINIMSKVPFERIRLIESGK